MGDRKSSSSSKAGKSPSKSSKEQPIEHAQMSQRSQNDPAASGMTRSFSASHAESGSTKERRPSKESLESDPVDDYDCYNIDEPNEEEELKPSITKRHSSSSHANVYTQCGRHGDDWLFGGIGDVVKSVLKKNEKK